MSDAMAWDEFDRVIHDPESTPLDVLRVVGVYQRFLDAIEEQAVKAARRPGATWEEIGETIGVSKQAAWHRLRHVEEAVSAARAAEDQGTPQEFRAEELRELINLMRRR